MEYRKGRSNLSATVFVPYDCDNHCPFCTSKKDYKNMEFFDINRIIDKIRKLNRNPLIQEYVITGGEPFANINQLKMILLACEKNIYINTTLPGTTLDESIRLINSEDKIKGINVSRHIGFEFQNCATINDLDKVNKPIRINTVITERFNFDDFFNFCLKYGKKKRDINLRADYRKIDLNTLKNRDYIFNTLANKFDYFSTESCMVCNSEYFSVNDEFICAYHRGMEKSSVIIGDKCYVNDVIIKQDGNIYKDWSCIYDDSFTKWILQ